MKDEAVPSPICNGFLSKEQKAFVLSSLLKACLQSTKATTLVGGTQNLQCTAAELRTCARNGWLDNGIITLYMATVAKITTNQTRKRVLVRSPHTFVVKSDESANIENLVTFLNR